MMQSLTRLGMPAKSKKMFTMAQRCFSLRAELEAEIKANKIVIYSKSYCPFCTQTKEAFGALATSPAPLIHELDQMPDGDARQAELAQISGQRTVPNIFIGGQHLGGNSDLCDSMQDGSLADMLDEAEITYKV